MKRSVAVIIALIIGALMCGCGNETVPLNPAKRVPKGEKAMIVSEEDETENDLWESEPEDELSENEAWGNGPERKASENARKDPDIKTTREWVINGDYLVSDVELDLGFNTADIESVESGTSISTLKTEWNASGMVKSGKTDAQATALRNKVLNAKNTTENYKIKGTIYYISPNGDDNNSGKSPKDAFKTTYSDAFTSKVKPGDAVLFERGGVWRLSESIRARSGVTYGAYGTGEKPALYMSPYNYARKEFWLPSTRENIWKVSATDTDIGLLVFDHGKMVGVKKGSGIIALEKNGDYYFNANQDMLYLYYDGGNPGKAFKDIEIGFKKNIFTISRAQNVTIDNLKLKYSGTMAVSMCNSDGSTITNCEIGFIGGAYQNVKTQLRFGNAIQQWNSVYNQKVTNNWIYQVYDTGISWQGDYSYTSGNDPDRIDQYVNIDYSNNLIEYCSLAIEFWHGYKEGEKDKMICTAPIENFNCSNNICRFSGYGWGVQRADHVGYHICVYSRAFLNSKNNRITNNLFDLSYSYIVRWNFLRASDNVGWTIENNTYYQKKARLEEGLWYGTSRNATNQSTLEAAVALFDTSPKHVEWIPE